MDDELALARLASRKLMGLVDGYLSVSLTSLFSIDPHSFIRGRNKLIASFVDVVRASGAKPGSGFARQLGEVTAQLSELTAQFYNSLLRLAGWRSLGVGEIEAEFETLKGSYLGICESTDRLFELLGESVPLEDRRIASRYMIEETKQQICVLRSSEQITLQHNLDCIVPEPASGR